MPAAPKTPATDEQQWETVAEARTKVIFDEDGDVLTAVWEGFEEITDPNTGEIYLYANFREDDQPVTTSAGYQLKRALDKVPVGKLVRLTRTGSTEVAKGKNPMTDFKVQVAK